MNDQIKKLALQCGAWYQAYDQRLFMHDHNFDIERFAQLIVKQCAEIADVERPNSLGCGYVTKTKGMLIREHFGVE
jgi:hypothetical protein